MASASTNTRIWLRATICEFHGKDRLGIIEPRLIGQHPDDLSKKTTRVTDLSQEDVAGALEACSLLSEVLTVLSVAASG